MEKVEQKTFEYCEAFDEKTNKKEYFIKSIFDFWHFASFDNLRQVKKFFKTFEIKKQEKTANRKNYKSWNINKIFVNNTTFWNLEQVPPEAKHIKALSNGAIVDCYYTISDNIITFYRPNPNAKNVYKPLDIKQHIYHHKQNGTY